MRIPPPITLKGSGSDQLIHRLAEAGRYGGHDVDDDSQNQESLVPVNVGEPPGDGDGHGGRDEIRGRHPCITVESAQIGDDARHGRGHDHLAKYGQKGRGHHADHRHCDLSSWRLHEIAFRRSTGGAPLF